MNQMYMNQAPKQQFIQNLNQFIYQGFPQENAQDPQQAFPAMPPGFNLQQQ